jgi:hypothetical protein
MEEFVYLLDWVCLNFLFYFVSLRLIWCSVEDMYGKIE